MTNIQLRLRALGEARRGGGRLRRSSVLVAAAFAIGGFTVFSAPASTVLAAPVSLCGVYASPLFGPNVCVFTPPSGANAAAGLQAIQTVVNNIAIQQVPLSAQFNDQGYALLFEPGTYGSTTTPLVFQVGYYTEVAGLGAVPQDTVINGQIDVFPNALDSAPQCAPSYAGPGHCSGPGQGCYVAVGQTCYWANSTVNFWRSLSNLDLNVMTTSSTTYVPTPLSMQPPINDGNCFAGSSQTNDFWSVSQATPVRSVIINGNIVFQSYCSETNYQSNNYGSGSYVANSEINGQLNWSGNQQGLARNTDMRSAVGYVWNYVYSGDGCPPGYTPVQPATACSPTQDAFNNSYDIANGIDGIYGVNQITEVPQSPVTQEEPFLYTDSSGNWNVFQPALGHNTIGPNFLSGTEAGTSAPIADFFVANPTTPVSAINTALAHRQNLILTPGVYNLTQSIVVPHPDTIVMGLGFPTLVPQDGNTAITVVRNSGVMLSGLIFDAGPVNSPVLLSVGTPARDPASANDPDLIQDIYFRIGGAETTSVSATVSLLDNADNSVIDDVWAWRADHGAGPVGWTANTADTGVTVTGDNVTAYGLAVEHYQKYEVIWSGQNGTDIFYQNELPYDPPSQAAWMATPTQDGYPAFYVTPNVKTFTGYGMGSYIVFIDTTATLYDAVAYEAPTTPGVQFHDVCTVWIAGSGGDTSIIDGVGGPDTSTTPGTVIPVDVVSYP
jgi:hypothetical protein